MFLYVVRRLLQIVPLLLLISAIIFGLLYAMPGDPLYRMLQDIPNLRPEDYERLRGQNDEISAGTGCGTVTSTDWPLCTALGQGCRDPARKGFLFSQLVVAYPMAGSLDWACRQCVLLAFGLRS